MALGASSSALGGRALKPATVVVPALAALTLLPWVPSAMALVMGIVVALTLGNPWPAETRALSRRSLTWSVVGLGAGMDLAVVFGVGLHGLAYTALGISSALLLGNLLGKRLGVARDTSLLITVGTAICGGSAIAAVAPGMRAKDGDVSIALCTVFLLNAVALVVFPFIGHRLHLTEHAFGLWCALSIHDTSSVVGAASQYGDHALEVATSAKLARALWIVPVAFAISTLRARASKRLADTDSISFEASGSRSPTVKSASKASPPKPWFIAGFLLAAAVVTFIPATRGLGHWVSLIAHRALATTLFLMGLGLTREAVRSVGAKPLLQGVLLWALLATGTLTAIVLGWIA